ncbi:MAG TPA: GyrI-like domain-containing protein [Pyrinomonadaceae bacterium]
MPTYNIEVQQLPGIPVAVIQKTVRQSELPRVVPECCGLVWNAVKAQQAKGGRHVAIYLDNAMRVEIGVELLGPFTETNEVVCSTTPAGLVVSTTHFGPYPKLREANQAIHEWARTNGKRFAGPSWEIYGHWLPEWNNDPTQIRTDVFYLLAN